MSRTPTGERPPGLDADDVSAATRDELEYLRAIIQKCHGATPEKRAEHLSEAVASMVALLRIPGGHEISELQLHWRAVNRALDAAECRRAPDATPDVALEGAMRRGQWDVLLRAVQWLVENWEEELNESYSTVRVMIYANNPDQGRALAKSLVACQGGRVGEPAHDDVDVVQITTDNGTKLEIVTLPYCEQRRRNRENWELFCRIRRYCARRQVNLFLVVVDASASRQNVTWTHQALLASFFDCDDFDRFAPRAEGDEMVFSQLAQRTIFVMHGCNGRPGRILTSAECHERVDMEWCVALAEFQSLFCVEAAVDQRIEAENAKRKEQGMRVMTGLSLRRFRNEVHDELAQELVRELMCFVHTDTWPGESEEHVNVYGEVVVHQDASWLPQLLGAMARKLLAVGDDGAAQAFRWLAHPLRGRRIGASVQGLEVPAARFVNMHHEKRLASYRNEVRYLAAQEMMTLVWEVAERTGCAGMEGLVRVTANIGELNRIDDALGKVPSRLGSLFRLRAADPNAEYLQWMGRVRAALEAWDGGDAVARARLKTYMHEVVNMIGRILQQERFTVYFRSAPKEHGEGVSYGDERDLNQLLLRQVADAGVDEGRLIEIAHRLVAVLPERKRALWAQYSHVMYRLAQCKEHTYMGAEKLGQLLIAKWGFDVKDRAITQLMCTFKKGPFGAVLVKHCRLIFAGAAPDTAPPHSPPSHTSSSSTTSSSPSHTFSSSPSRT